MQTNIHFKCNFPLHQNSPQNSPHTKIILSPHKFNSWSDLACSNKHNGAQCKLKNSEFRLKPKIPTKVSSKYFKNSYQFNRWESGLTMNMKVALNHPNFSLASSISDKTLNKNFPQIFDLKNPRNRNSQISTIQHKLIIRIESRE